MPDAPNGRAADAEPAGNLLAAEMLRNLVLLNERLAQNHELYEKLADGVADLIDYHETYMRGFEILAAKSDEGKNKFTISDIVQAMAEAADEVMGEGEEEDEPGEEDPRVRVR